MDAALDATAADSIDTGKDEAPGARAARAAVEVVKNDPKFFTAWADLRFQRACWTALEREATRKVRQHKGRLYLSTVLARLPEGKTIEECFTESELASIGAECGLTEEDLKELRRENELKFN